MTPPAPWKITHVHAGLRLRRRGLPYTAIAVVLDEYHGLVVNEEQVRAMLRQHGAPPKPHGPAEANFRPRAAA